jgi:hypothetical protein
MAGSFDQSVERKRCKGQECYLVHATMCVTTKKSCEGIAQIAEEL